MDDSNKRAHKEMEAITMDGFNKRAHKESTSKILEEQNKYLMLEMKEMKSMMMKHCNAVEDEGGDEIHQSIIALTKTTEDVEAMSKTLFSKQRQACDELKLALKKIAMKSSSSSQTATANTSAHQNMDYKSVAEEQKVEIEQLKRELEMQLLFKKALELEVEQLKVSTLNARNSNMGSSGDENNLVLTIDALKKKLEEKEELIEQQEALSQTLIIKERSANDELQEARKELIRGIGDDCNRSILIGLKRMGDLDAKPFQDAIGKKHKCSEVHELRSISVCCLWEEYLRDPNWHPFKIIEVGGKLEEVIDEEDELLKGLKDELGEDVYEAVKTAAMELNEYNPSGREPVQEIWNFKAQRRATLKEGISFVLKQLRTSKRSRR